MLRLPKFEDIEYLSRGSVIQQKAYRVITKSKILYHLKEFHPVVTGSLPIDLFIDNSDIDISCSAPDLEKFKSTLIKNFQRESNFSIVQGNFSGISTVIGRFHLNLFPIEIFCQSIPVSEQHAYKHMVIEYQILQQRGTDFKNQVLSLKNSGHKTEPAFAKALGIDGDPYHALLHYKIDDDQIVN